MAQTKTLLRCAVLLSAAACLPAAAAKRKPGYFAAGAGGMCYKFFGKSQPRTGQDLSWAGARNACRKGGARLATFAGKAEHDVVVRRLQTSPVYKKWPYRYWIGYTDKASAGNWLDTVGAVPTPYAANLWRLNWPKQSGWRCATLWSPNGLLNTRECYKKRPYICMYKCGKKTTKPAPKYKKFYSPAGRKGNCFKAVYAARTQQQAVDHCEKEGGRLAHFDGGEMRHARVLMRNEQRADKSFWLDGKSTANGGQYTLSNDCRVRGYMATLIAASQKRKGAACLSVHYKERRPVVSRVLCNERHNFVCVYRCNTRLGPTDGQCTTAPPPATKAPATKAPITKAPVTEAPTTKAPVTEAPTTKAPEVPKTTKKAYKAGYWPAPEGKRGVCYKAFGDVKETAAGAANACQAEGARLANFVDAAEFDYLMLLKSRKEGPYWLDGSDAQSEAHFAFSDGTDFTYANTKFSEGNPDNYGGAEHCLATDGAGAKTLNDGNCGNRFSFFCMYQCE